MARTAQTAKIAHLGMLYFGDNIVNDFSKLNR